MSELDSEVQAALAAAREHIRAGAQAAVSECAETIADQARADCPVASGRLRESIGVEVCADGDVIEAQVAASAPYAAAVELGSRRSPPRPFLFPALEAQGARLVQMLHDAAVQ